MSQEVAYYAQSQLKTLVLPNASLEVLPGIVWGAVEQPFTPAFWAAQVHLAGRGDDTPPTFRLGRSFHEEAVACLLGGHGIPAEMGLAAFEALRSHGFLEGCCPSEGEVCSVLERPLRIRDRHLRYRFARQKGRYVAALLQNLNELPSNLDDRQLRDWLLQSPGIGLKTASWIVRNWRGSDSVAIIDIHLHRAGLLTGFFTRHDALPKSYLGMEERYLDFALAIGVQASLLDAIIWQQMRQAGKLVHRVLEDVAELLRPQTAA